jgi:predicted CoA-binding protein
MPITSDDAIRALLTEARIVALVGISDSPLRPSNQVMAALQEHGYRVYPVNPRITGEHIHGEYVWRELAQIGEALDIVDVFRRAEEVDEVVDQAIAVRAKAVWMQLGIVNEAAAARAEAAGLIVVMDRCTKVELKRLGVAKMLEV